MKEPATREEERARWESWCDALPLTVRPIAERFPPWKRYRRKSTRQTVVIWAFDEGPDGKVSLKVETVRLGLRASVYGVDPSDIEEF